MKKVLCLTLVMLFATFSLALGATKTVKVSWNANADDTTGYKVYINGAVAATVSGIATTSWTGSCTLVEGVNKFTLTAFDAAGNESAQSDPALLNIDTVAPGKPTGVGAALQ